MKLKPPELFEGLGLFIILVVSSSAYYIGLNSDAELSDFQITIFESVLIVASGYLFIFCNRYIKKSIESEIRSKTDKKLKEQGESFTKLVIKFEESISFLDYDSKEEILSLTESFKGISENLLKEERVRVYLSSWLKNNDKRNKLLNYLTQDLESKYFAYFSRHSGHLERFRKDIDSCLVWLAESLYEDAIERQDIIFEYMASVLLENKQSQRIYISTLNSIPSYNSFTKTGWFEKSTKLLETDIRDSSSLKFHIDELIRGLRNEYFLQD